MRLSDEQIRLLLDRFVGSEDAKIWIDQRLSDHKRWKKWIDPEIINTISDEELKSKFLEYFNEGAGRHPFNAIYRDRIVRDGKFRDTIKFLIDESIQVKERLNQVLDKGDNHIQGFGKGLATSILMDLNLQKYSTWNNRTDMGLEALGLTPEFSKGDNCGARYAKVMDQINYIKNLKPELSFLDVDHFLHIVSAEEEGKEAVKTLVEGKDKTKTISETIEEISEEKGSMEFVMEKYLEEFIEANFSKIGFGMELELYQDEENGGRQYPTPIGNIDLLAIDNKKKVFVVIELKKGRSSDVVVGQILRYMGWVKQNLGVENYSDYSIKGIIITKDKDVKLEYALSMIENIGLFLYSVSFDLKRVPISILA